MVSKGTLAPLFLITHEGNESRLLRDTLATRDQLSIKYQAIQNNNSKTPHMTSVYVHALK